MPQFSTLVFLFAFFCKFLFADDAASPAPQSPQTISLVNMTAAPSSYVNNSVNVITGDYISSSADYTLSGPDPYVLGHSYVSSSLEKGNICHGFSFLHSHILRVFQPYGINFTKSPESLFAKKRDPRDDPRKRGRRAPVEEEPPKPPIGLKNPYTHLFLIEPCGGKILFKGDGWAKHFKPVLKKTGYTNSSSQELSGKTNIKNATCTHHSEKDEWEVAFGDGLKRIYARRYDQKKNRKPGLYNYHIRDYHLIEERKPSGNKVLYEYNDAYKITKITTVNHDKTQTLNWVKFHYRDYDEVRVETSDGYESLYKLKKIEGRKRKICTSSVQSLVLANPQSISTMKRRQTTICSV